MNRITNLEINYIKGKSNESYALENCYANKVNLFIAPNGFGKTTIATAFKSLKTNRMDLKKEDTYKNHEDSFGMSINVMEDSVNLGKFSANSRINELNEIFDVTVINESSKVKASILNVGGQKVPRINNSIPDLILYNTIPKREIFKIDNSMMASELGMPSKLIRPLYKFLEINVATIYKNKGSLKKLYNGVRIKKAISEFSDVDYNGTVADIKQRLSNNIKYLLDNPTFSSEFSKIDQYIELESIGEIDKVLFLIIAAVTVKNQNNHLTESFKYQEYSSFKKSTDVMLDQINTTGRGLKLTERKGMLVLKYLDPTKISNGQRDVLTFITQLIKVGKNLTRKNHIIVIDEVFDYLDAANLIFAQYFLVQFIEEYKKIGGKLYVILMTHLDPTIYNLFSMSGKILKTNYLEIDSGSRPDYVEDKIKELLQSRFNPKLDGNLISEKYFHYHPHGLEDDTFNLFVKNGFPKIKLEELYAILNSQLNNYLSGEKYCVISVCLAIRIFIEKNVYLSIEEIHKEDFLRTFKTVSKLNYVSSKGYSIPEVYSILSSIYNPILHWDGKNDNNSKIKNTKIILDNLTINNIVRTLLKNGSIKNLV